MTAVPPSNPPPTPTITYGRFQPETVFDLLRPIEGIIEIVAREHHGVDLRQAEARKQFIAHVDQALLAREPSAHVVPPTLREALVARLLRTFWWGQGGVLETESTAA